VSWHALNTLHGLCMNESIMFECFSGYPLCPGQHDAPVSWCCWWPPPHLAMRPYCVRTKHMVHSCRPTDPVTHCSQSKTRNPVAKFTHTGDSEALLKVTWPATYCMNNRNELHPAGGGVCRKTCHLLQAAAQCIHNLPAELAQVRHPGL
jgi:hypothetical protein